ncbi:ATP-dependent RNA helicase Ddx27/Drs1 [Schizosaccharomyces japonicus yFS275]|uniref:ATP-dependent RNA helicase DRS1 n=1 Tax=Schizosaccharomyces japonicus (strain yFS275 / FY16936) TaxID=402676 RepID=B6K2T2_SCHJY|nr:ATP-dependent RNA helicase Ddx27/Drs1 [Schizosaccharomyces japonicus yFS275]EEB08572.1 ATP-dependent RNA helicase Ddx27/Drs1 [Schizosaccharomyces japonicus yFS275]
MRAENEFILTIEDSEDDIQYDDSEIEAESDMEAEKETKKVQKKQKKKKNKENDFSGSFMFESGINDGVEAGNGTDWDFQSAKNALRNNTTDVDLNSIIQRNRKQPTSEENKEVHQESSADDVSSAEEEEETTAVDSDEESFTGIASDDEDLATDGFGGAVKEQASDSSDEDSDEDDITVPVPDTVPGEVNEIDSDSAVSDDDEEQARIEREKSEAYFAAGAEDAAAVTAQVSFQDMKLSRPILRGLSSLNFEDPTPIQSKTIPVALLGKDIVGAAVTGSGKTAAFVVPILERLVYRPKKIPTSRVLIICPTRELAMQCHNVAKRIAAFTDITLCLCVGGLSLKVQEQELRKRPDIIIATPGRFIDHVRNSQGFSVDNIEIMVIDEADRMLEDGFADELNEIVKLCPKSRQTMLFSATMTEKVDDLVRLSLNRPVRIFVDAKKATAKRLVQEFIRVRPQREQLRPAMLVHICKTFFHRRVIIFFRNKAFAHKMRIIFGLVGLNATEIHGSLSQEQRVRALEDFRDGKVDYLLATDVASRGLDIKGVEFVINYEAPASHEIYLHRVGRTARAGRSGRAISLVGENDRKVIKDVLKSSENQHDNVVSRNLDFPRVEAIGKELEELEDTVKQVMEEEKQERHIKIAERDLKKGENILKHQDEIKARPARTWFQTEKEKKASKTAATGKAVPLSKRKKAMDAEEAAARPYKKTRQDRMKKGKNSKSGKNSKRGKK